MNISHYKNRYGTEPTGETTLNDYLEDIRSGLWQDFVLAVRSSKGKVKKDDAPGVTVSGTFEANRRADALKAHSGFIAIDLDDQDNEDLLAKREALQADPYCYACHTSIRGFGLVWYVKVSPERHKDAFYALEQYLANTYNVIADSSGKDVSRFRFVSYDPDLYMYAKAKKWATYIPKKDRVQVSPTVNAYHSDDIKHILDQIQARGINIAEDYDTWIKIAFALATEFGEEGRAYFHVVSAPSAKYDAGKCDRQYDISLRRQGDGIGISTFFWHCNRAGIETKTTQTQEIELIAKQRLKTIKDRSEAMQSTREYFAKMEGVEGERVDRVLEGLADVSIGALKAEKTDDKTLEMELFIKGYDLRFNRITRKIEHQGEPVTDRTLNSIYLKAMHAIGHEVSKAKIFDMIDSELIPEYDPFKEFFQEHKDLTSEGHIKELLACFTIAEPEFEEDALTEDERAADYLEVFLTRWLVSIISSMHGIYSLLVLVLTGGQSVGKTKFFRGLLPESLQSFYGESKLDKDKDDGILMCQKLILMDDEFSGKSKREAAKFKEISSRETFTVRRPYGKVFEDLPRIAVLCGTTNEEEILNDVTGNRRLIPINVVSLDLERFAAIDKVALFMELYRLWKEIGNAWMLTREEITYLNKSTKANEEQTFEGGLIEKYFSPSEPENRRAVFMSSSEIKEFLDSRTKDRIDFRKLTGLLKKLGFEQIRVRRENGFNRGYYVISHVDMRDPFTPSEL